MNRITRWLLWPSTRLLYRTLMGRSRSRSHPEQGRFSRSDVKQIIERTIVLAHELGETAPREQTLGARIMVRSSVFSLAIYRAIRSEGVEPEYATELAADFLWAVYQRQVGVQRWLGHLLSRRPHEQMAWIQRIFLRFPLASPGYRHTIRGVPGTFAYDIERCPARDYFDQQGEEACRFFRNSWCTLDYPLAEYLVRGGRYERLHTLSDGDAVCDMRWRVVEKTT